MEYRSDGGMEWSTGVMEYWSDGVMGTMLDGSRLSILEFRISDFMLDT
jgi:hypothetical protein